MSRRRLPVLAATLALGVLPLAACGGTDPAAPASAPAAPAGGGDYAKPAAPGTAKPPAAVAAGTTVQISNFAFAPQHITVKAGQKITWTNKDTAPHTVTASGVDSGAIAAGHSFSFTPKKAGTISYVCSIHPDMRGTITVR